MFEFFRKNSEPVESSKSSVGKIVRAAAMGAVLMNSPEGAAAQEHVADDVSQTTRNFVIPPTQRAQGAGMSERGLVNPLKEREVTELPEEFRSLELSEAERKIEKEDQEQELNLRREVRDFKLPASGEQK